MMLLLCVSVCLCASTLSLDRALTRRLAPSWCDTCPSPSADWAPIQVVFSVFRLYSEAGSGGRSSLFSPSATTTPMHSRRPRAAGLHAGPCNRKPTASKSPWRLLCADLCVDAPAPYHVREASARNQFRSAVGCGPVVPWPQDPHPVRCNSGPLDPLELL